jgi:hypothetical protein
MKKKTILSLIAVFVIYLAIIWYIELFKEGFDIKITNDTDQIITDLTIGLPGKEVKIRNISKGASIREQIVPEGPFSESEITLNYNDWNGRKHQEPIFGYIEPGYKGRATIKINSINQVGIMKFDIKADYK